MSSMSTALADLPTPALLVDVDRMAANISSMAGDAARASVALRPHFKTSKCLAVARAQLAAGACGFTAATAAEVAALGEAGIEDVFWAHQPVGPSRVDFAVTQARRLPGGPARAGLTVAIDSVAVAGPLSAAAAAAGVRLRYLIEVDTGLGRCGVPPGQVVALAADLAGRPGLQLRGIFTHEGHVSRVPGGRTGLEEAGRRAGEAMVRAATELRAAGHWCDVVSVGSTPGATSTPHVPGVTESRAGTYVFQDAHQVALGSATLDQCALTVLARVVTARGDTAIIDAGTKAMSSDPPVAGVGFGRPAGPGLDFPSANEEHGYLGGPAAASMNVGDLVRIVPNHACTTVNMWRGMYAVRGGVAIDYWQTVARH